MQEDWDMYIPSRVWLNTALKSITAEEPRWTPGFNSSSTDPACPKLSQLRQKNAVVLQSSRQAVGHFRLHSGATFRSFAAGLKFTSPVELRWILSVRFYIQQEPDERLKRYRKRSEVFVIDMHHSPKGKKKLKTPYCITGHYWDRFLWHPPLSQWPPPMRDCSDIPTTNLYFSM